MKKEFIPGMVSVIMSNYNTPEEYLRESIDSILNQTYENFEFIIVDDCSTDDSCKIIESYNDERIRVIRNECNMGITKSLNVALGASQGEFVARMDSDDVCLPERFERQVSFLRENKEVIVCGVWADFIGEWQKNNSRAFSKNILPEREEYRINLLFKNYPTIVHSSAMFNKRLLEKYEITYFEDYYYAQDYRMWVECSKYAECSNIPEVLFKVRFRGGTISTGKAKIQMECATRIMAEQLSWLGIEPNEKQMETHNCFLTKRVSFDKESFDWIKFLILQNRKSGVYDCKKFENKLWTKWAETTYFELANNKRNIVSCLRKMIQLRMPLKYYPELFKLWRKRAKLLR